MKISWLAWLSPPQNDLFAERLDHVQRELSLELSEVDDPSAADLAYICGLPASRMLATHRPIVAPALKARRYQGKPWYFVDVVGRTDSGAAGEGPFAYNQPESFSGWMAVRHGLRLRGIDPDSIDWVATGSHVGSLDAVRNREADLAGIDSMIFELAPDLAEGLAIIDTWGPWPTPPVVVCRTLDPALQADLTTALTGEAGLAWWVPIDDSHLDPICLVDRATIDR